MFSVLFEVRCWSRIVVVVAWVLSILARCGSRIAVAWESRIWVVQCFERIHPASWVGEVRLEVGAWEHIHL